MLQQPTRQGTRKSRVKYPDIVSDANALALNRVTLWRYLDGKWPWPVDTKRRYDALQAAKMGAAK